MWRQLTPQLTYLTHPTRQLRRPHARSAVRPAMRAPTRSSLSYYNPNKITSLTYPNHDPSSPPRSSVPPTTLIFPCPRPFPCAYRQASPSGFLVDIASDPEPQGSCNHTPLTAQPQQWLRILFKSTFVYSDSDIEIITPRSAPGTSKRKLNATLGGSSSSDDSLPSDPNLYQPSKRTRHSSTTPTDRKPKLELPPPKPTRVPASRGKAARAPVRPRPSSQRPVDPAPHHAVAEGSRARSQQQQRNPTLTSIQDLHPNLTEDEKATAILKFFQRCKGLVCQAKWSDESGDTVKCEGGHPGVAMARQGPFSGRLFVGCSNYRDGPRNIHMVTNFPSNFPIYDFTQAVLEWSPNEFTTIDLLTPAAEACISTARPRLPL